VSVSAEILDYRDNPRANKRWSRLDTGEPVISRWNGLPITGSCLGAGNPNVVTASDADIASALLTHALLDMSEWVAPEQDPA
jgi:hypothetical protein